jgi:hypothetical protein
VPGPLLACGFQHGAQARDDHPERLLPISADAVTPQLVDDPVGGDDLVGMDEEQRALLQDAEIDDGTVADDLDRARHAVLRPPAPFLDVVVET